MMKLAVISDDGVYRYSLSRIVDPEKQGTLCFVMLNPSTADHTVDDPTIRRCIGFTKTLGLCTLVVVNLFAFRATKPSDLFEAVNPVGPENFKWIEEANNNSTLVVAAWGANGGMMDQDAAVKKRFRTMGRKLWCLGKTKYGYPRHPLYIKADKQLEDFS